MTLKQERMDQILLREISRILQFELKNPKLGFVTVTDVQCTRDMSQAKVYVSFLGKQERNDAGMKILRQSKGFIKSILAKNVKAYKIPDLIFVQDKTLEKSRRIENILDDISRTRKPEDEAETDAPVSENEE